MSWLRIGIAVVITGIWAVGYVLSYFSGGRHAAPTELLPLMLLVAGFLFTSSAHGVAKKLRSVIDRNDPQEKPGDE